jgi:REP element-mobilizing transposase RayT
MEYYASRRHLPHLEEVGGTYFVTVCLKRGVVVDLTATEVGNIIVGAMRHFDATRHLLFDYTVMPDHVHCILKPLALEGRLVRLADINHSLKSWTAQQTNRRLGRSGPLWQDASYDHLIRNQADYEEKAAYILDNPRRKGLVANPTQWPWWGQGSGLA